MYLLYDIVVFAAAMVLAPWYLVRGLFRGARRQGYRERLGFIPPARLAPLHGRPVIWIHAVSVGESRAALPLVREIRRAYPGMAILMTTVTETGRNICRGFKEIDLTLYFPLDLSFAVGRVLDLVRPQLTVIVETELWPNFIRGCRRRNIPVVLANGRVSDRSFPRYRRVRKLLRPVLAQISRCCMQSDTDAERLRELGAPADRVLVTGNVKFDLDPAGRPAAEPAALRREFGIAEAVPVWVAGSTHEGEEAQLIEVFRRLVAAGGKLLLILVPRHPHRCRQVGDLLDTAGLEWRRRTAANPRRLESGEVLLVDTVGEMLSCYAMATAVFVGGSLVPIGGHNVLEAALVQKPVLFGPHMHNFRDIAALTTAAQGFGRVADAAELEETLQRLLQNGEMRYNAGRHGWEMLQKHAGASRRTLAEISRLLPPP
ncbi:MAG: 3-deoxy-D-manno-octulosonic acid transferase [Deltaproteobacteria bacterium]|nr:3-deoxy-D-manno-octulosonic acid transferase [Candidatus Anaeroferrophillacea bacterium]